MQAKVDTGRAPNAPDWQAIGFGSVWVANSELHAVQRIDPASNKIIATIKPAPIARVMGWPSVLDHFRFPAATPARSTG